MISDLEVIYDLVVICSVLGFGFYFFIFLESVGLLPL